jgi:hypothetical protein
MSRVGLVRDVLNGNRSCSLSCGWCWRKDIVDFRSSSVEIDLECAKKLAKLERGAQLGKRTCSPPHQSRRIATPPWS